MGTAETTIRRPGTAGWGQWRPVTVGVATAKYLGPPKLGTAEAEDCRCWVQRRPGIARTGYSGDRGRGPEAALTHFVLAVHVASHLMRQWHAASEQARHWRAVSGAPRRPQAQRRGLGSHRGGGTRRQASGRTGRHRSRRPSARTHTETALPAPRPAL